MNAPKWSFFIIVIISALYVGTSTRLSLKGFDTLNKIKNKRVYNKNISNIYYKKLEPPLQENHNKSHEEKWHDSLKSKIDDYFYNKLLNYFLITSAVYMSIVIFGICVLLGCCDHLRFFLSHCVNVSPRTQETQSRKQTIPDATYMRNMKAHQPAVPLERRDLSISPIEHLAIGPENLQSIFYREAIIPPERGIRPQQIEMESERSTNVSEMNVQRSLVQADQRRKSIIRTDIQRTVGGNVQNEQSSQILIHSSYNSEMRRQIVLPAVVQRLFRQSREYGRRSQSRSKQSRKNGIWSHHRFRKQPYGRRTRSQSRSRQCQAYDSRSYTIYMQQEYDADNSS